MRPRHPNREFAFQLNDVARLLRTYANQEARHLGMTRAQWAVLYRLERFEGLKQSELADILDLQPITLTRLIDRLCQNGLIERRADPADRRAKRLFLTPVAKPLMDRLDIVGRNLMATVLNGIPPEKTEEALSYLTAVKDNLRQALQGNSDAASEKRKRYG